MRQVKLWHQQICYFVFLTVGCTHFSIINVFRLFLQMCVSFKTQVPASVASCHRLQGLTVCVLSPPVQMLLGDGGPFFVLSKQMQLRTGHPATVPHVQFKEEANLISLTEVLLFCNCSPVSFSQSP